MKKILTISGSARKGSFNSALIAAFETALSGKVDFERLDFSAIPFYNQDHEASFPKEVAEVKSRIKAADGIIIATPEYNRSIPGYLKNMIDWTSRPYGDNAWKGKAVFVTGASGGSIGTALAQYDLKKVMLYLDAKLPGQPELYVNNAHTRFVTDPKTFSTDGTLTDADTKAVIENAAAAFIEFIS